MRELRRLDGEAAIVALPEAPKVPVLSQTRSLAPRHWRFVYLSDLGSARASARNVFLFALLLQALLLMLVLYGRQRRQTREHLEAMVAERTTSLREMTSI
jgi:two-component system C4-dicarboxylate transport sensor histidine kinase DctB